MSHRDEVIRVSPRDFITAPFEDCPECGARDQLGHLMIAGGVYRKRCRECMHDVARKLPELAPKHVVYLDQMAVSNLLKSQMEEHEHKFREDKAATHYGFWPRLRDQLTRLVHLNLVACPRSSVHEHEAAFDSRLSDGLRAFHAQLAADVDLRHHQTVKRFQLDLACRAWLDGRHPEPLDRSDVVAGRIDEWLGRYVVNAHYPLGPGDIATLRARRDRIDQNLQRIFGEWRTQRSRSFEDFYTAQLTAYGPSYASAGFMSDLMIGLRVQMEDHGVARDDWSGRITEFLHSEAPTKVAFAQIAAGLFAALAWRAARDQLSSPTRGLAADLQAIATYLPYVDAMFVDNECARLLREPPLAERLPYGTLIFSQDSRSDFVEWLSGVERDAPAGHAELVEGVYGSDWLPDAPASPR